MIADPPEPYPPEISQHKLKLLVGVIAISLASFTNVFAGGGLTSISVAYHSPNPFARDFFVGSLFAISAFLFAYNGYSHREMLASKAASFAALGVAVFPCCEDGWSPKVHYASAAMMFLLLAVFCHLFQQRASSKPGPHAKQRARIYSICGTAIIAVILILGFDVVTSGSIRQHFDRLVFFGEAAGLMAFGVAWLTASRILPGITAAEERVPLF